MYSFKVPSWKQSLEYWRANDGVIVINRSAMGDEQDNAVKSTNIECVSGERRI